MDSNALKCPACGSDDLAVREDPATGSASCMCWACGERFSPAAAPEGRAAVPLKLFLSYGHPEEEIALRMKEALEARGHEVWVDRSEIKAGDDWREEIAAGVSSSNGVIACLSKHSVRDPGVCRDEIDIAIGVRGGNVKTVLLGPEEEVRPAAAVSGVQWLDMSGWREAEARGEEAFGKWFSARMAELARAVESPESARFSGQITDIAARLEVLPDSSRMADLLSRPFVGRGWLAERVRGWMSERESPRAMLLTGDAGVGKSAFAAHLAHWGAGLEGSVAAAIFCEAGRDAYNDPRKAVQTLAFQMACRIPQYRVLLHAALAGGADLSAMGEGDLLSFLLLEPLSHAIDGGHAPMLVVVDGLDEAGTPESNPLAEALARFCGRLPSWVKLLATSRRVGAATSPFGTAAELVDLAGESEENMADVRAYLERALPRGLRDEAGFGDAVGEIAERSGGAFLYASLVADALASGKATLDDALSCPPGLDAALHRWFSWTFPDISEYKSSFRAPLGCILAAPGGLLPESELRTLSGWGRNTLGDFLSRCGTILARTDDPLGGPSVKVAHAYVASWLASPAAGPFRSDPADGAEAIASRWHTIASSNPGRLTGYEAANLYDMLLSAGKEEEYESDWDDGGVFARVRGLTDSLRKSGRPSLAAEHARRLLGHGRAHAASHPLRETALLNNLAYALDTMGRPSEAEPLLREALAIRRRLAESDPAWLPDVAKSLNNLAVVLEGMRRPPEAAALHREALAIRRGLAESDPAYLPDVARSLSILALAFAGMGHPTEAEPLYREALAICWGLARSDPRYLPDVVGSLNNLALTLGAMGRTDEANQAARKAATIQASFAGKSGK